MLKSILMVLIAIVFLAGCGTGGSQGSQPPQADDKEVPVMTQPDVIEEEKAGEEVVLDSLETSLDIEANTHSAKLNIHLKNTSNEDVTLTFTSGQKYEIVIKDQAGKEVYRYSIDKLFIMAMQTEVIKAGETLTWTEDWDYLQTGERVPAGKYEVTVEIVATQLNGKDIPEGALTMVTIVDVPQENVAFRNVKVVGMNGEYTVTGEARVFEASFFYAVEDGHDYLIKETVVEAKEGAPSWAPFELSISIPTEKLPTNGTLILELFERSAKDGKTTNLYELPLEQFK